MRQVFRLWQTPPKRTVMNARTMLTPRSVEHIAASWHSKAAALSKKGGAEELQHPVLVSGGDRVAGGVWYGEVHVVIRVRPTERTSPSISSNNQHPSVVEKPGFLISGVSHHLGSSRRDVSRKGRSASRWNI